MSLNGKSSFHDVVKLGALRLQGIAQSSSRSNHTRLWESWDVLHGMVYQGVGIATTVLA